MKKDQDKNTVMAFLHFLFYAYKIFRHKYLLIGLNSMCFIVFMKKLNLI